MSKKPISKHLLATWRLECELGIINDFDCPVDGGWSPWSPWSKCLGSCDNIGHRKRIRECNNPSPSIDGMPCNGVKQETDPCYLKNCSVEDFRKIVEGDTARTEALRQLEAVPALMEQCLRMECPFEAIEAALATENIWQVNSETIWNALQCVKHDLGCSLKGEWGSWGSWSACGARCGKGLKWKLRKCDTPSPSTAHLMCLGTPIKYEECEGEQCAIDGEYSEHNVSGSWGEWGCWTKCSEKCGMGIRRRNRTCIEKHISLAAITWGTHCRGQYDQLEICVNKKCVLNGGWSGWGSWGPCSQSCGSGKRSRTRSCTRPIPSDEGKPCMGSKIEVGSCNLTPCDAYGHTIAVFNGDSVLQYNLSNKRSTFLHFYVRFMPLSPHGTLIRRGTAQNPRVRLSLQKWHVCLDASGSSKTCSLPRTCSPSALEPSNWHSILITITNNFATLRINDALFSIQSSFPCDPELTDDKVNIFIGERLRGEVQELILNFIPLSLFIERERRNTLSDFYPISASNIVYEKAGIDEAYLYLEDGQYLILPCFKDQDEWQLELTLKSQRDVGTILFLSNDNHENWLFMGLQNMRLKMKLLYDTFQSEATSSLEYLPDQWLHVALNKKRETNTIVATINSGERFHVFLTEDYIIKRKAFDLSNSEQIKHLSNQSKTCIENKNKTCINNTQEKCICGEDFFIGGVPIGISSKISEDITSFAGIIAAIKVNNDMLDIHDFTIERIKDDFMQLSSRSASITGSYHETSWGDSNMLNLTCVHARILKSPQTAYWLYLDSPIEIRRNKNQRSIDDGRVLRLFITADYDCQGFYTCRGRINKRTRNFVTYGVLGKINLKLASPDTITVIAMFTTVSLVIFTLSWLMIEGYYDVRDGYGFFRDAHLSPEEEAEIACKYIDQNTHLVGSESAVYIAKRKARSRGKRLASRVNFGSQEPEGKFKIGKEEVNDSTTSEPEDLPALPEIKSSIEKPTHNVYRCEPSYVSSPRHGSIVTSLGSRLSSSSLDTSPRVLCSRLLMTKCKTSREKLPKKIFYNFKNRPKLGTIKSSTFTNTSPVQKVLQKFRDLASIDVENLDTEEIT
ncbi:unnamed protein product, partial [Brenthis ino]